MQDDEPGKFLFMIPTHTYMPDNSKDIGYKQYRDEKRQLDSYVSFDQED